ncbi:MAG: tetratricopeptide repeat protein, partial [Desulfobacterales bacterium]
YEKAIAKGKKALSLDPNGAETHFHLGYFLHIGGKFEEAIPLYEKAIRLNPYPPSFYYQRLGAAYGNVGRYNEAIELCRKGLKRNPRDVTARLVLAAVYIWQDRKEEAQVETSEILRAVPQFSLRLAEATSLDKNKEALKRWIEAWRKAGLPD